MDTIRDWIPGRGTFIHWRPPQRDDEQPLDRLVGALSAEDRRRRFHGAVNGLTPARLQRMVSTAPGELALVAVPAGLQEVLVADVRCVVDATGGAAEFALMVAPAWRRRGVATLGLAALGRAAADAGLRWLYGQVLADNLPMLALMRRCGFSITPHRGNHRLVMVERSMR